jgi:hypothetical protein
VKLDTTSRSERHQAENQKATHTAHLDNSLRISLVRQLGRDSSYKAEREGTRRAWDTAYGVKSSTKDKQAKGRQMDSAQQAPGYPSKRVKYGSPELDTDEVAEAVAVAGPSAGGKKEATASSFRNVSACNRCRLRKNRCDQKLPSCASCEKAGVKCVGYDPITKREIPRR